MPRRTVSESIGVSPSLVHGTCFGSRNNLSSNLSTPTIFVNPNDKENHMEDAIAKFIETSRRHLLERR